MGYGLMEARGAVRTAPNYRLDPSVWRLLMHDLSHLRGVCVYCGSSDLADDRFKAAARDLGTGLARAGVRLVYGGGRVGLMGAMADAVHEAGGRVTGIIPEMLRLKEAQRGAVDELLVVDSMHSRKQLMVDHADAFVILPGGLGTLDETFEITTWRQLGLHNRPIILANIDGYWDPLLALAEHMIAERFVGTNFYHLVDVQPTIDAVLAALAHCQPDAKTAQLERL